MLDITKIKVFEYFNLKIKIEFDENTFFQKSILEVLENDLLSQAINNIDCCETSMRILLLRGFKGYTEYTIEEILNELGNIHFDAKIYYFDQNEEKWILHETKKIILFYKFWEIIQEDDTNG